MDTSEPQEVFGMIVRQFRLLLQAREVLDEGGGVDQIRNEVVDTKGKVHPYVAGKIAGQAAKFSMESLNATYHRLLELDMGLKTSQITFELAMDTLVAELTQF
jgi:DNA polymerase-3 subunit delta